MASDEKVQGAPSAAEVTVPVVPITKSKRGKTIVTNPLDAVTAAALSTATLHISTAGYHGLATLLAASLQEAHPSIIPSVELVKQAARKAVNDQPVWVHWSKQDMAPQFKVDGTARLSLTGALRGYRMARASHGVASGCYYFECFVLPGPSATEILNSLPANARLGPGLREQLQQAVEWEEKHTAAASGGQISSSVLTGEEGNRNNKKRKVEDTPPPQVGGHVRIGWSMRTGDLQAPVGYDKWSYGIRDIGGSILHCSQRQDNWGGESFAANDVIGCAICFDVDDDESNNHIRFFKNGDCMGQFVISKGKREGGEAFRNIERGTYYPAVSCYMGGTVRVNFGPHWVYPPKRSRLPTGLKNLKAISSLCPPPVSPEEAVNNCLPTAKLFRKVEHQQALKDAVQAEAGIQCQAYADFLKNHYAEIRQARSERGLSVADLPEDEGKQEGMKE